MFRTPSPLLPAPPRPAPKPAYLMEAEDPMWGEEREADEGNTFQMGHKAGAVNPTQPGDKVIKLFCP